METQTEQDKEEWINILKNLIYYNEIYLNQEKDKIKLQDIKGNLEGLKEQLKEVLKE